MSYFRRLTSESEYSNHRDVFCLLFCFSGLVGFVLGAFCYPSLQEAVEPCQILAGTVHYPALTPNFVYQMKIWSILHQLGAVFLCFGGSEKCLSFLFSGLVGMVSFQALTLTVWAFCNDLFVSLACPFLFINAMGLKWSGMTCPGMFGGNNYSIYLMGTEFTHGMVGLSYTLLVLALFASKKIKAALLLTGVAVAVHPSWGICLNLVLLVAVVFTWKNYGHVIASHWRFYAGGIAVTGISFGIYLVAFYGSVTLHKGPESQQILKAFISYWDIHRGPINFSLGSVSIWASSFLLSLSILTFLRPRMPAEIQFIVFSIVLSMLIGFVGQTIINYRFDFVPQQVISLMPSRFTNLAVLFWPLALIGLLNRYRNIITFHLLMIFLFATALLFPQSRIMTLAMRFVTLCLIISLTYINFLKPKMTVGSYSRLFDRLGKIKSVFQQINFLSISSVASKMLLMVIVIFGVYTGYESRTSRTMFLENIFTDRALIASANKPGFLLNASPIDCIQAVTRRPVLLTDYVLTGLPYVPESGPSMNLILEAIYGVSILDPPEEIRRGHLTDEDAVKELWESRSPEEWSFLAKQFHFSNILTYAQWHLNLPVVCTSKNYTLYDIPG